MARIGINLKTGKAVKASNVIVGIDLGTTNSLVAYLKDETPIAVKDKSGKSALIPSIVHFAEGGNIVVGEAARAKLISEPENTIYSVKRLMGKSYKDVADVEQYFGYQIIDEDEEKLVKVRVGDKFYTPIELSSEILKKLKTRIEGVLEATVSKAVITVPAYFNDAQRQATRDAGKLAGLDVLRIVNEPTAASLAYGIGLEADESKLVAVYDLGGGTFDISILQIDNGIFEVLSTNGDTFLGGDDFDRAIVDYWVEANGIDPTKITSDKEFSQTIRLAAEDAKKTLSSHGHFEKEIGGIVYSISKTQFNTLIQPLIDRTINSCKQALSDAKLSVKDIESVIMVGGSTRVPLVKESVATFFEQPVNDSLNPDEVVAIGAAIQADILAGNNKNLLLIDITPLSLGIETVGGLMDTIIPRNSKVPIKAGRQYTTSVDGQKNLKVSVYQGERDLVEHNRKLGEFILSGIPPMPMGIPKIEIHFILDADGILKVRAKELRSGVEQTVEMRSTYGISEEDMAEMLLDSIQNAQTDMATRALLEARNEADNVIKSTEKFIEQNREIFSESELATLQQLAKQLYDTAAAEDKDAINKAMEELNEYARPLAHKAMDATIGKAMSGKKIG